VYAVGHVASTCERRWMGAVLACGGYRTAERSEIWRGDDEVAATTILERWGAAVSHRDAAALWGLLPAGEGPVDVSVPGDRGRATRRGIRLHRCPALAEGDVTLRKGIPSTTPARTIRDLRRAAAGEARGTPVAQAEVRRAIRQANVLGLRLGAADRKDQTRSDLERDFLRLCRRYRLPEPEVNVRVGGHLVDFYWPPSRLIVETDGYRYHSGPIAFRDDRRRAFDLRALGYEVIRLSEEQVNEEAGRIAAYLRERLGKPGAPSADL